MKREEETIILGPHISYVPREDDTKEHKEKLKKLLEKEESEQNNEQE